MRGLDLKRHEQQSSTLLKDTRALSEVFFDVLRSPMHVATILAVLAVMCFMLPSINDLVVVMGLIVFSYYKLKPQRGLPARVPSSSGTVDPNDMIPGTITPRKSRGIFYFGNEKESRDEIWFGNDDLRTHGLLLGTTGCGKTEALVSIAFNALVQGSGLVYVDGKGDSSLWAKIFALVRFMGREDDLLVVNFMTGARDIMGPQSDRLSNTMNPFSTGSSSMLSNLISSLMDDAGGEGGMWKGRAISFIEALMKILVFCRDRHGLLLDAGVIRDAFALPVIERVVWKKELEIKSGEVYRLEGVTIDEETIEIIMDPITNYVVNLPGYKSPQDREKAGPKGAGQDKPLEQHGYITMQLTRIFGSLSDTYRHITKADLAEVDFNDVVMNRRILVVLLPALEKSPDELANLGKVIIASLKSMMAAGLGSKLEGTYRDVIESKPTNAPTPFLCVLDEYGYYAVNGFAVVAAQARSLGFSAIFAGQDIPAFEKASKEEAASIIGNTAVKIAMQVEEKQTFELFRDLTGEAHVAHVSGWQRNPGSLTNAYTNMTNASIEKRSILELRDLKAQRPGEATIVWKDQVIRSDLFYANPPIPPKMKVNTFLRVKAPTKAVLSEIGEEYSAFCQKVLSNSFDFSGMLEFYGIDVIVSAFERRSDLTDPLKGVAAFMAYVNQKEQDDKAFLAKYGLSETMEGPMDVFGALDTAPDQFDNLNQPDEPIMPMSDEDPLDGFGFTPQKLPENLEEVASVERQLGILDKTEIKNAIAKIEAGLTDDSQDEIESRAENFVADMSENTTYYSGDKPERTPELKNRFDDMLQDLLSKAGE